MMMTWCRDRVWLA